MGGQGMQGPSCAVSGLPLVGKPMARNLAGDWTNSQGIRRGRTLETNKFVYFTYREIKAHR